MDRIKQRVDDILKAIETIEQYTRQVTREAFLADRMRQDAVARQILIIAEACDKISALEIQLGIAKEQTLARRRPQIPWRSIRDMGIRIRHVYADEDPAILWSTAIEGHLTNLQIALREEYPRQ